MFCHTAFRRGGAPAPLYQPIRSAPYATADVRFAGAAWPGREGLEDYVAFSAWLDELGVSNLVVGADGRVAVNGAAL